jgi:hypothetical protein
MLPKDWIPVTTPGSEEVAAAAVASLGFKTTARLVITGSSVLREVMVRIFKTEPDWKANDIDVIAMSSNSVARLARDTEDKRLEYVPHTVTLEEVQGVERIMDERNDDLHTVAFRVGGNPIPVNLFIGGSDNIYVFDLKVCEWFVLMNADDDNPAPPQLYATTPALLATATRSCVVDSYYFTSGYNLARTTKRIAKYEARGFAFTTAPPNEELGLGQIEMEGMGYIPYRTDMGGVMNGIGKSEYNRLELMFGGFVARLRRAHEKRARRAGPAATPAPDLLPEAESDQGVVMLCYSEN